MKTKYFIFAASALVALASCSNDEYIGDNNGLTAEQGDGSIQFTYNVPNATRAGELIGATAADKLGGMFVVEGTKGSEQATSPSTTVVFDNYLVGYTANTAGATESNTHNWEYVGKQAGIDGKLSGATWTALHPSGAQVQSIKYWDYSTDQYDFIAWSTGNCEAIPTPPSPAAPTSGQVQVSRINQVTVAAPTGFTMRAATATDLKECYYTDVNKVLKADYNKPVVLTFRNMAAKVRVALYETVPGYSVKDVQFYTEEAANVANPADLAYDKSTTATLFTTGTDKLPQSGIVTVLYPRVGDNNKNAADYNKASVTVTADASTVSTQTFGALTNQYVPAEAYEGPTALIPAGKVLTADEAAAINAVLGTSYAADQTLSKSDATAYKNAVALYLGRTLPTATFAGDAGDKFYQAVIPNTNGKPLMLRVNYTLVSTDGSGETIKVYGAKAVVPATYTNWLPNYAYTYIFKISDNSNGWTSTDSSKDPGLFPITFDAVVTSFVDYNAEQTTVTTVSTPSITTYQQGHDWANNNEYSKNQKAGADNTNVKDLYVQVMSTGATPALISDLNDANKSSLYLVSKDNASEAEVMDALQNRTNNYGDADASGRNGITLTKDATNISNTETQIVNGVDDQPITKIAGVDIAAGQVAKINIDALTATKTYAYVYATTVPSAEEKIYQVAAATSSNFTNYYKVTLTGSETPIASGTAAAGKVYFVKNVDDEGDFVSYTFKQTKVGVDDVTGLVEATIPGSKASGSWTDPTALDFYFDVYNQNNGEYAVKVFKVVN